MSGIAGLIRFDGRSVARRDLERAANALDQYGPDRVEIIAKENCGLAHALMRMTPEDRFDRQPYQNASGSIITADLRLDNRDESACPSRNFQNRSGGVAGLAFAPDRLAKIGGRCLAGTSRALCSGDLGPAQPLRNAGARSSRIERCDLAQRPGIFCLCEHAERIFAFDDVPRELCEEKLADFLVLNHADHATTMYRNVFRVPPAHLLHVKPDGSIAQRRYWSPADIKNVRLRSDSAYADGLRDCLDRAVRRQMRSIHPIGSLLSGGLELVFGVRTCRACPGEKRTCGSPHSPVFPDAISMARCRMVVMPTRRLIVEAIRKKAGNIDVDYVHTDACDDFAQLERFFIALDGPVRNPTNFGWTMAMLHRARAQGRRVLLGGLHGNYTISWNGWSQASTPPGAWSITAGLSGSGANSIATPPTRVGQRCESFSSSH